MKLSVKFFCIAYIIVLLTTGLSGSWLINTSKNALVDSRAEQTNAATKYAIDSFISFSETTTKTISGVELANFGKQIKNTFGNTIMDIKIIPFDTADAVYKSLDANKGFSRFIKNNNKPIMEDVYRVDNYSNTYFIVVTSDFSDIDNHYKQLWLIYGIVILLFAILSGIILYFLIRRITKPIYDLSKTANNIATGNYGKTIQSDSNDVEILELTDSFNRMSLTIEEKIEAIEEELSKRDVFVSNFTHEIKTPMTAIIGYSQMLNTYTLDEEEKRKAINSIYNESSRLEKLAMQLLDLYVYKNENVELGKVGLNDIGKEILSTFKFVSEKFNVKISVSLNDCEVFGNRDLLLSLLYNLVDNAIKASTMGSEVKIYSLIGNNTVKIYVTDNGNGIKTENIKHLTEPFYREDKSRSRKLGGAGLGLSLCQKIADIHNTSLIFESEKNKGTTVSFELKTEVPEND